MWHRFECVKSKVQVGDIMERVALSYTCFHLVRNEINGEAAEKQCRGFDASQHIYTKLYLQNNIKIFRHWGISFCIACHAGLGAV